jgi:hypothetical protein
MSTVELKELRQEVKKYIDHADEKVVKMMYAMLETDAEAGWWEHMPDEIKDELEESIAQSERGQTMTHEQVKKKYPQWFTK